MVCSQGLNDWLANRRTLVQKYVGPNQNYLSEYCTLKMNKIKFQNVEF